MDFVIPLLTTIKDGGEVFLCIYLIFRLNALEKDVIRYKTQAYVNLNKLFKLTKKQDKRLFNIEVQADKKWSKYDIRYNE